MNEKSLLNRVSRRVVRCAGVAGLFIVGALSGSVHTFAQDRAISTHWLIEPDNSLLGSRVVADREYVLKQRLLPAGLVQLDSDVPSAGLKAGDQLIELMSDGVLVFCDPQMRPSKMMGLVSASGQFCFVDADRDGAFEGMFRGMTATKSMLMINQTRPKKAKPLSPVAYHRIDSALFAQKLFVGIQYRGNAGLVRNHVFQINFGSDEKFENITERMLVKPATLDADQTPFGALYKVLAETPEGIRVEVSRTMPAQPFNVEKITTIRFY